MTWTNFLAYVKRDFKRTDKDTEILQAYNDTILDIATRMPNSVYKYQSWIPLQNEQEDYPLPSNIIHMMHPARLLEGNATNDSGWNLNHITKQEYDERYPTPNRTSPQTGVPSDYTIYSGSILLGPIPNNDGDLLEINWTKQPVDIASGPDVPALGDEWREPLKMGTLFRLYWALGMFEEADRWYQLYENPRIGVPKFLNIDRDKEGVLIGKIVNNPL